MAEFRNLPLRNLHESGLAPDAPRTALPPTVWSDGRNIRFNDGAIEKIQGTTSIFNQAKTDASHMAYWATPGNESYLYVTNSPVLAEVFRVTADGTETNITRSTAYTAADANNVRQRWQSSIIAGGYAAVLNNRLDAPQYILEDETAAGLLQDLPGWDYLNGTAVSGVNVQHTTAGVIESFGSVLIAGDLTYYSSTDIQDSATTFVRAPSTIRVSARADRGNVPRAWDPFPTTIPAGGITFENEFELADTSPVIAISSLQGNAYIFTGSAIHQMTPDLGEAFIITNTRGALNAESVIEANGVLYCIGSDDIYTFSGHPSSVQSIADTRVREEFYRNLHPNFFDRVFMVHNTEFNEVWICYPRASSVDGFCDEALIFNYINNTWTRKDMDNVIHGVTGPSTGGGVAGARLTVSGRSLDQGDAAQAEIQTYTVAGTVPTPRVAERQTESVAGANASTFTQAEVFTLGVDDDIIPTNRAHSTHTFTGNSGAAARDLGTVTGTTGNANSMDIDGITGFNLVAVATVDEVTYTLSGVPAGSNIELVVGGITLTQFNLTTTFEDTDVTRTWSLTGTVPAVAVTGTTASDGTFTTTQTGTPPVPTTVATGGPATNISGFTGLNLTATAVMGAGIEPFTEATSIANTVETMSYDGGTVDTLRYTDIPLTAQAPVNSGWAGRGVGVSNEWLAIGNSSAQATIDGTTYTNAGQITVFRWNDTTRDWDYHQNILPTTVNTTAPTGTQNAPRDVERRPNLTQSAGVVVSADGMWMAATRHASTGLIDAPSPADNDTFVGEAIEFYQFNTTTELWERNGEVALNHTESNDNFVHPTVTHMSMSPNGEWVAAIGNRTFNDGTDEFFIINFFRRTGTTWTLAQTNRNIINGFASTTRLFIKLNNDHAICGGGGSNGNLAVLQLVGDTWTEVQNISNADFLANGYVGNVNDLDSDTFSLSGNSLFMYVHNSFTTVREFVRTGLNQPFDLSSGAMSSDAITGLAPNAFASGAVFSTADGLTLGLVRSGTSAGGGVTGYARIYTRASLTDPFVRTFEQVGGVNGAQPQPISGRTLTQYNDGFFAKDTMGTLSFELETAEASPDPVRVYRGVNEESVEYTLTNGTGQTFNSILWTFGAGADLVTAHTGSLPHTVGADPMDPDNVETHTFDSLEARPWSVSFGTADGFTLSGAGITPVTTAVSFPGSSNATQMGAFFADYVNNNVDGATAASGPSTTSFTTPEPSASTTDFWGNLPSRPATVAAADGSVPTDDTYIFQSDPDVDSYIIIWEGTTVGRGATRAELEGTGFTGTDGSLYFADDLTAGTSPTNTEAFAFTEFGTPPNTSLGNLYFAIRRLGPDIVTVTRVRTRNTTPLVPVITTNSGSAAVANVAVENAGARLTEYTWNLQGPPDAGSAGRPTSYAGGTYDGVVVTDDAEDIVTDLANNIITAANRIDAGWTISAVTQEAGHRVIHITSPDAVDRVLTVSVTANDGFATALNEGLGNEFDGSGETVANIVARAPNGGSHMITAFNGESVGSLITRVAATITAGDETPDWTAAVGIGDPVITLGLANTVNFNANSDILSFVNPPDAGTLEEDDRVIIEGSPTAAVNGVYEVQTINAANGITQLDRVGEVFTTSGSGQDTNGATIRLFGITYTADDAGSHDGLWRLTYTDGNGPAGDIAPALARVARQGSDFTWAMTVASPGFSPATSILTGTATTLDGIATELAAGLTTATNARGTATATGPVVTFTSAATDWYNLEATVGESIEFRDQVFDDRELEFVSLSGVIGPANMPLGFANASTFTTTGAQVQQGHPIVPQSTVTVDHAVETVIPIRDNVTQNFIGGDIRTGVIGISGLDASGSDNAATISVTNLTPGLAAPAFIIDDFSENVRVGSNGLFPAGPADTDRGIFSLSLSDSTPSTDRERPWLTNVFNFSREFVVTISNTADIHTNDIGYTFGDDPYESFVERRDLLLSELVDNTYVKSLNEINILGSGTEDDTNVTLSVNIDLTDAPSSAADLSTPAEANDRYDFTFGEDYKVDLRETGRMLNYRITDNSNATIRWRIAGIDLMAAVNGTR